MRRGHTYIWVREAKEKLIRRWHLSKDLKKIRIHCTQVWPPEPGEGKNTELDRDWGFKLEWDGQSLKVTRKLRYLWCHEGVERKNGRCTVRHWLETQWFHFNASPSSDSLINQKPVTDVILRCCYHVITGTEKLGPRDLKSNSCYWLWLKCLIYKCRCYLLSEIIYMYLERPRLYNVT